MRIAETKQEDGTYKRVMVKDGDEGKDPNVLYQVTKEIADFAWAESGNIERVKEEMLERMIDKLRQASKIDEFWKIKTEEDFRKHAKTHPFRVMRGMSVEELVPQAAKDGKVCIICEMQMPFCDRYRWEDFSRIQEQLNEILK